MFEWIRERFSSEPDEFEGCRAVVNEESGELCGDTVYGRDSSGRVRYCREHIPSEAVPYGRIGTVTFYIPEDDEFVERE